VGASLLATQGERSREQARSHRKVIARDPPFMLG